MVMNWEEYMAENSVHTIDAEMAKTLIGMLKSKDKDTVKMAKDILAVANDLPETTQNVFKIKQSLMMEGININI